MLCVFIPTKEKNFCFVGNFFVFFYLYTVKMLESRKEMCYNWLATQIMNLSERDLNFIKP